MSRRLRSPIRPTIRQRGRTTPWDAHIRDEALSKVRTYIYDAASQLTKLTDRNNRITEYAYGIWEKHFGSVEEWHDRRANYVIHYDAANNLLTAGDAICFIRPDLR